MSFRRCFLARLSLIREAHLLRRFPSPILFVRRSVSSRPESQSGRTSRKNIDRFTRAQRRLELSRINGLISAIEKCVLSDQPAPDIERLIHGRLSSEEFHNPLRHIAYERTISCLLSHRLYSEAISLYERMIDEELLPPATLNATLLAVSVAMSTKSNPELAVALEHALSNPSLTEAGLLQLINFLGELEFSYQFRIKIAELYINAQPSGYTPSLRLVNKIVGLQARAGFLENALDFLLRDETEDSSSAPSDSDGSLPAHPYAAIIAGMKETQPQDSAAINLILDHMRKNRIPADTSVFNALISLAVKRRSLTKAFSLYHVLLRLSEKWPLRPNDFTFGSLFAVLRRLRQPNERSARTRNYKSPDNIVPPRTLYRDMIKCHLSSPNPILTPFVLNVALRMFLTARDYAGAFVIIRTFKLFHIRPTIRTYYIVMKILMDRIRYNMWSTRCEGESRWGDYMLGLRSWKDTSNVVVDSKLAEKVLKYGERCQSQAEYDAEKSKATNVNMPTLAQIDGDEPLRKDQHLDAIPLERILRRAIKADIEFKGSSNKPTLVADVPISKAISQAVAQAKLEMIPQEPMAAKWRDYRRKRNMVSKKKADV